jgi:hypothetical protein
MSRENDWWARQSVERIKEIARAYDRFCTTREIGDFDKAYTMHEELNEAYKMSFELLDFVKFGRAWLGKQTPPHTME